MFGYPTGRRVALVAHGATRSSALAAAMVRRRDASASPRSSAPPPHAAARVDDRLRGRDDRLPQPAGDRDRTATHRRPSGCRRSTDTSAAMTDWLLAPPRRPSDTPTGRRSCASTARPTPSDRGGTIPFNLLDPTGGGRRLLDGRVEGRRAAHLHPNRLLLQPGGERDGARHHRGGDGRGVRAGPAAARRRPPSASCRARPSAPSGTSVGIVSNERDGTRLLDLLGDLATEMSGAA